MQRLCERIAQPPSSVPRAPESPVPPPTTPVTAPAAAVPLSAAVPVAPVAPARGPVPLTEAEQERWTERLARFRRFDPPIFDGRGTEAWIVEGWVSAMEKLFEDLFVPEGEEVPLGVHCLAGDAHDWWRRTRRDQGLVAAQLSWDEFCGMLFGMFFPNSVKQKLEEDLRRLQQGDRPVQEYVREFTRLLNCVPFVARDEAHRVYMFEQGLRPDIFRLVRAQRSRTLDASISRPYGWREVRGRYRRGLRPWGRVRTGSAPFQITEGSRAADVRRDLHDHVLRVVGLRGVSVPGDPVSRGRLRGRHSV